MVEPPNIAVLGNARNWLARLTSRRSLGRLQVRLFGWNRDFVKGVRDGDAPQQAIRRVPFFFKTLLVLLQNRDVE